LPSDAGVDAGDCIGKSTSEPCTMQCEQGFSAGDGSLLATCSDTGAFESSIVCNALPCDISSLPFGFVTDPCLGVTTADVCAVDCRLGFTGNSGTEFTCQPDGTLAGSSAVEALSCVPGVVALVWSGGRGDSVVRSEITFSVSKNSDSLVAALSHNSSDVLAAVATSFTSALQLQATALISVLSARPHNSRNSTFMLDMSIMRLNSEDATMLRGALGNAQAVVFLGAHLEYNFMVGIIDVGVVHSASLTVQEESFFEAEDDSSSSLQIWLVACLIVRAFLCDIFV